jgi:hypothetical protein
MDDGALQCTQPGCAQSDFLDYAKLARKNTEISDMDGL